MKSLFLDTSTLAKRYIDEIGSEWVSDLFVLDEKIAIYIADITTVELTSAIIRRSKGGSISLREAKLALTEFDRHLLRDYHVLELDSNLLGDARQLVLEYGLRGYDAIQLAVAERLNRSQVERNWSSVTFVSADNQLVLSAKSEGLLTENPNNYP